MLVILLIFAIGTSIAGLALLRHGAYRYRTGM
jgi:hypothetical protein